MRNGSARRTAHVSGWTQVTDNLQFWPNGCRCSFKIMGPDSKADDQGHIRGALEALETRDTTATTEPMGAGRGFDLLRRLQPAGHRETTLFTVRTTLGPLGDQSVQGKPSTVVSNFLRRRVGWMIREERAYFVQDVPEHSGAL